MKSIVNQWVAGASFLALLVVLGGAYASNTLLISDHTLVVLGIVLAVGFLAAFIGERVLRSKRVMQKTSSPPDEISGGLDIAQNVKGQLRVFWSLLSSMAVLSVSTQVDLVIYLLMLMTALPTLFSSSLRQRWILCASISGGVLAAHFIRFFMAPDSGFAWVQVVSWCGLVMCLLLVHYIVSAQESARLVLSQKNQQLQEAVQAKNFFFANMSHEIRTPMNGILGMLDVVLSGDISDESRRYLGVAQTSAHSLLTIINDILDFSKIEAGKLFIEPVPFDISRLIHEVVSDFSFKAEEKNLELILDIAPSVPLVVKADPVRLRQVLNHLLSNALKFTERGEIVLALEPHKLSDGRIELLWSVRDSGIGIDPERQQELFSRFVKANASTTRLHGGTGLGLAISKQLCQLMGGAIGVESELGQGSRFFFTVPVELADHDITSTLPTPDFALLDGKRILVVDDNATNRLVLRKQLEHQGALVMEAEDADQALALMARDIPMDMALLDMQMPRVDGLMLAERTRLLLSRKSLLLVLLSSALQDLESERLRSMGISACLCKPVPPQRLYRALGLALANPGKTVQAGLLDFASPLPAHSGTLSTDKSVARQNNQEARLLLVEDDATNQDVAAMALDTLGYQVDVASDGKAFLDKVMHAWQEGRPYKLILMDCLMPVMNGYEATKEFRLWEQQKRLEPAVVIAMTANAMAGDKERCVDAGMDDYMCKPIQLEVLQEKLNQWLRPSGKSWASEPLDYLPKQSAQLVWDLGALRKLVRQKEERMVGLLQSFLAALDGVEKELIQSLQRKDWGGALRQVHSLRGSSSNLGARALPAYLEELELKLGMAGELNVPQEIQLLQAHIIRLKSDMQSYLDVNYHPSHS